MAYKNFLVSHPSEEQRNNLFSEDDVHQLNEQDIRQLIYRVKTEIEPLRKMCVVRGDSEVNKSLLRSVEVGCAEMAQVIAGHGLSDQANEQRDEADTSFVPVMRI